MNTANQIRFAISDETDQRLIRLLRHNPNFAPVVANPELAPLDRLLEHIFSAGLAQFERLAEAA